MKNRSKSEVRRNLILSLFVLGSITAIIVMPFLFGAKAAGQKKGLYTKTESADPCLPNYDIRTEKSEEIPNFLLAARNASGKDAVAVADIRDAFVRGEESLRTRVPSLKVEYNLDIRIPEVITPDVWTKNIARLTGASSEKRSEILRNFVKENNSLVGMTDQQANDLTVTADYTNPDGNLSYAYLEQRPNGIPVFRSEVKAGFTHDGRIIRVINNLAPGLDYNSLSVDFRDPLEAVKAAARNINHELKPADVARNDKASDDLKVVFGTGDWATTAEKMYFPTEPGVAVPAWRVLIWQPVNAYYVIVDAATGTMLWRKNITSDQTQQATYNVYSSTLNLGKSMNSPAPLIPGPIDPTTHTQAPLGARTNITLIGNEGPLSFNTNGWMTDGTNGVNGNTSGNALIAGLDRDGTNGVDAPQSGFSRIFNFSYIPGNVTGGVDGGDSPLLVAYQGGAVTQLFYLNNRYHDALYQVGFTEAARNFQLSNFGRGGVENDRVSGEAQDSSGTNNANFATPADGTSGRMQMYIFTGATPNRDGDLDADIVWHEHTHGLSNRLIGNGSGLTSNRSGSSGEGWSDFYAFLLAVKTTDPVNSVFTTGGYATYRCCGLASYVDNYYYGIRRLPYAPIGFTGGPSNRPHNPLTLADIGTITASDAAYPCSALINCSGSASEVHNAGEIWAVTGVEVWAQFATRLGNSVGTLKTMQIYTDGMKLSPLNPTYIQSRDAIIAAASASPFAPDASIDVQNVREGFRLRGMGFSATDNGSTVVEAFDLPNAIAVDPFSVSDSTGDNDGFPEPGENVLLSVAVKNPNTGATINSVVANVNGGLNVSYGNIADGATVTMNIPFTIPPATVCGSNLTVAINVSSALGAQAPQNRTFRIGVPVGGAPVTFTNSTALTIPDSGVSVPYGTTVVVSGLTGQKKIKLEVTGLTHTFPDDLDYLLVGPGGQKYSLLSDSGNTGDVSGLTFTLSDNATAQPSTTQWVAGDFNPVNITTGDTFPPPAPAAPYSEAPAAGAFATFNSVFGGDGTTMNGTWTLYLVDDAAGDSGTQAGWKLTFETNDYACSLGGSPTPTATPVNSSTATATPTNTSTTAPTATATASPSTTTFPGSGVGNIPDATACGPSPGVPLNIFFNVSGIASAPSSVDVSMTFGSPNHTWMGDIVATLIAPNGTTHPVFGVTGSTTATGIGDSSDLGGSYLFSDIAPVPPSGGWWQEATVQTATGIMSAGTYRTTASGGAGQVNPAPPTSINATFAGIPNSNGTWTLRLTDGCSGDTGNVTAASLTLGSSAQPISISGIITYGNAIGSPAPPRFVKNVSVASTAGSPPVGPVITGTPGTYSLTGFGAGSYTIKPTKPGGANGSITSNDAARVSQGVSGAIAFVSQNQRFVSDASGNGTVTSNDAALIGRFAAGLSGSGNSGQWKFFVTGAPSPLPTAPQTYNDSRTYATVAASVSGEDYVGLLIGEASGNWNPATHPRPAVGPEKTVSVELPQIVASTDKEITVPVNVQGAVGKDIISYEFNLRYDPAVMQPAENPVDVAGTASRGLFAIANPNESGLLRIVVYGPMPISENGLLLNLRFTPVGSAGAISPLTLERLMFNEGDIGILLTDGQVEMNGSR